MIKISATELEKKYNDAVQADQADYDEKRTNILLVSGFHYSKKTQNQFNRIRESKSLSDDTKLRITKNHLGKIMRTYSNNLLTYAPGATIVAREEQSIHDKIQADISRSVWEDGKYKSNYTKQRRAAVDDFFILGECWIKQTFEPDMGEGRGYAPAVDEMGQQMLDEMVAENSDTLLLNMLSDSVGILHSQLKKFTYKYYLEMKNICSKDQQKQLEQIFNEMFTNDMPMGRSGQGGQRWRHGRGNRN